MTAKAYSYIRFSTPEQAGGDSIRRQTNATIDYCTRHGLQLDETLHLADHGISAWRGRNSDTGNLGLFVDLCERGVIPKGSVLIIEHLDRLSRQEVRQALQLFFRILDTGVTIVTLSPERTYTQESTNDLFGLIEPLMQFASANDQSTKLSMRLREVWAEKRKQRKPLTKSCPAWLRLKEDGSGYELIPEHAEVVRGIVGLALDGYGDKRIIQTLNHGKVPCITGHTHYTNAFVAKMLRSPSLMGVYEPGTMIDGKRVLTGEQWPDYYPAVISAEEYFRLQARRRSFERRPGPVGKNVGNLFKALLYNARDGLRMHRIIRGFPVLISEAYRNGLSGDTTSIPYGAFETAFVDYLAAHVNLGHVFGDGRREQANRTGELERALEDVESRIAITKDRIGTAPDVASLLDVLTMLDGRRRQLQEELETERDAMAERGMESAVLDEVRGLVQFFQAGGREDPAVRTRLRAQFERIIEDIWILVIGVKRSKYKEAFVQVNFAAGGVAAFHMWTTRERLEGVQPVLDLVEDVDELRGGVDLRLLLDAKNGETTRAFVERLEAMYNHRRMEREKARR